MTTSKTTTSWFSKVAVFSGFFIMGFVDIVGVATNYIKNDFSLSSTLSNTIPLMVFVWFALFSIPAGILMGRIGKRKTVLLALLLTVIALVIPYVAYSFGFVLLGFSLLGISNTLLQVSLNPLVASLFTKEKTASILTTGQLIKSISSLLGPILAGTAAAMFGDWKVSFLLFAGISLLPIILLSFSNINEHSFGVSQTSFMAVLSLLANKKILFCFLSIMLIVGLDVGINTSAPELLMRKVGLELSRAGLASSVYFFAKIAGATTGAFLLLKSSPIRFLRFSLAVAIGAFFSLMFSANLWILMSSIFIIGFTCANVFSIIFSFALKEKPDRSNEISALLIMGVSGGAVILPLQGLISDTLGFTTSIYVLVISLVLLLLFTYKINRHATR